MSEKVKQVVDILKTMSVWEFSEATTAICKEFDVTGEAPAPIVIEKMVEESAKDEFDVIMVDFSPLKKIRVIKAVRTLLGTMLKETKDLVEAKNLELAKGCNKDRAGNLKRQFEELGCTIVVK